MGFLATLLTGPIVQAAVDIFDRVQKKEMTIEEAHAELSKVIFQVIAQVAQSQAKVIIAELQSDSWLAKNWRPMVALTSYYSIWFVIFAYPFLLHWGVLPQVRFGEVGLTWFMKLTLVCVGGYIGGRTIEKVTKDVVGRWRK